MCVKCGPAASVDRAGAAVLSWDSFRKDNEWVMTVMFLAVVVSGVAHGATCSSLTARSKHIGMDIRQCGSI